MTDIAQMLNSNLFALSGSLALLVGYHLYLQMQLRRNPRYTIQAINNAARSTWVENIMASGSKDILAVQTLRNSTMAATFLASTAILLIIGVLNLSQSDGSGGILNTVDTHDSAAMLHLMKLSPLLLDMFAAFFCFSFAIRMYNHVGYLINSGGHPGSPASPAYVARLLNRGGWYYSLGMRSYYLSVPFVFWLLGAVYMLAASLLIVVVLYHVDRSPEEAPTDEEAVAASMPRRALEAGMSGKLSFLRRRMA